MGVKFIIANGPTCAIVMIYFADSLFIWVTAQYQLKFLASLQLIRRSRRITRLDKFYTKYLNVTPSSNIWALATLKQADT